jgi:hypothetical protein
MILQSAKHNPTKTVGSRGFLILTAALIADGHSFSVARKSQVDVESSTALQSNGTKNRVARIGIEKTFGIKRWRSQDLRDRSRPALDQPVCCLNVHGPKN